MPQVTAGVLQEGAGEVDVLEVVVRHSGWWANVESDDLGAGDRHEDWRVRGHDELTAGVDRLLDHRDKRELTLRRKEGRFPCCFYFPLCVLIRNLIIYRFWWYFKWTYI